MQIYHADEELHRHAIEKLAQADALLFGRVTYEMMEQRGGRGDGVARLMADWMEPFARTIDAAKKYVVSSTLDRVDWNAELVRGDLEKTVQQLKRESGKGLFDGRREAPAGIGGAGLDRRVRIRGAPQAGRPRADIVRGDIEVCRLEAREPAGVQLGGGCDAL